MQSENSYINSPSNISCSHEEKYIMELNPNLIICFKCSSMIYKNEIGKQISPVKPEKYSGSQETATPIFLSIEDTHRPYRFCNKESYLKIRAKIIKKMKIFVQNFNLTKKTFFLALNYFDRICSRATKFNLADFTQIALLCVVLSAKFQDDHQNALNAKLSLGPSNNYTKDELYVLQLLNYDLYSITSYDIVMDIMHTGILFNDENFSINKMKVIYGKIEKMIYFFSEKKYYIEMTPTEIALSVIGFIREALGLVSYNNILQQIFMNQPNDFKIYSDCLILFKNCFQIQEDTSNNKKNNNEMNNNNTIINYPSQNMKYNSINNNIGNN